MPNWCNNTLELSHEDPAMITRAKAAFMEGKLLNEFHPLPEDLNIDAGPGGAPGSHEQELHEAKEQANKKKYGYKNWYDWCCNNWGTKWDVGGDGFDPIDAGPNKTCLTFDSAWAPPINAMEVFVELGFSVRLYYYEPGMAFAGIWEDGIDAYYDISGMSSDAVEEELPEALDEMFGISVGMAEWEQTEEDEENIDIDLDGGLSATNE